MPLQFPFQMRRMQFLTGSKRRPNLVSTIGWCADCLSGAICK